VLAAVVMAGVAGPLPATDAWGFRPGPLDGAAPTKPHPKAVPTRLVIAKGPDSLQLLSQPAWVGPAQTEFGLRLDVTASDEANESLTVNVYEALSARSEFQAALAGDVPGAPYVTPEEAVPLAGLEPDPAGGVDVDIPVNQPGSNASFNTGVYPVQVFLEKDDVRVGNPLTTFLVYAGADARNLVPLEAALVVPLATQVSIQPRTAQPGILAGPVSAELQADIAALDRHRAPVTLEADVPTLEALADGSKAGAASGKELASAVGAGDELLPSPALPLDIPSLVASHLTAYLQAQLSTGNANLGSLLGRSPSWATWAFPGGIDASSAAALARLGARQLVVPESDLSQLPAQYQVRTFAWPTTLGVPGARLQVMGADTELSARVGQASAPGQAVLVANQVLAELAMVDLETPSYLRGIVLLPGAGTLVDPTFLSVFLAGLQGDPLVRASTVSAEFQTVPPKVPPTNAAVTRYLEGPGSGAALPGVAQLSQAAGDLAADQDVFGPSSPLLSQMGLQLMVSVSSVWDQAQRSAMIAGVVRTARSELAKVRLPPSIAITLTSHQGRLPLTILSSSGTPAHVRLVLSSEELSFVAQRFSEGSCTPVNLGSESCQLTLTKTTTLQVPVTVRTSGVFQLSLVLDIPNGGVQMATSTDTVRSTATNDVALALMVGAVLFLAGWWLRNARHGRRAKKLVPRPVDQEPADSTELAVSPVVGVGQTALVAAANRSLRSLPSATRASPAGGRSGGPQA
jgi:hypothetical protein